MFKKELSAITGFTEADVQSVTGLMALRMSGEQLIIFQRLFLMVFFGRIDIQTAIREIKEKTTGMGVCARVIQVGEYAWKCRDCQLDLNAIQCCDCFSHANHEGHSIQYIQAGGGCCDCGDFGFWSESGSCVNHRGFEASRDAMLKALSEHTKNNGQRLFSMLIKCLKKMILQFVEDASYE